MRNFQSTSKSSSSSRNGVGVFGLLGVAFVVLKLIGKIDWSWWLVTLPFWGGIALVILIILVLISIEIITDVTKKKK